MCSDERQRQPFRMTQTCLFLHEVPSSFRTTVVCSALVLGQAHTPKRRLVAFAVLALAVLVAPAFSIANSSHKTASLRARDAAIVAKSRAAVLDLYSLDHRLANAQTRLASLEQRARSLRSQQASLRLQLAVARHGTRIAQGRVAQRLRALYEGGDVEPLEVVLGSKSLDEALTNLDNLTRAVGQGQDVLRELHRARSALTSASRELAARQAALAASVRDARATTVQLANARSARTSYIASLATQRRMTEREIAELEAQARAAQDRSARLAARASVLATARPADVASPDHAAAGAQTITVTATGYALPGRTATGLRTGWGVIAVDPSLIPLGTHVTVPGYGEGVAADTGGGIVGTTIDLWFPSLAQANAWGRRTVTIVLH